MFLMFIIERFLLCLYLCASIIDRRRRRVAGSVEQRADEGVGERLQPVVQRARLLRGHARDAQAAQATGPRQHHRSLLLAALRPSGMHHNSYTQ